MENNEFEQKLGEVINTPLEKALNDRLQILSKFAVHVRYGIEMMERELKKVTSEPKTPIEMLRDH